MVQVHLNQSSEILHSTQCTLAYVICSCCEILKNSCYNYAPWRLLIKKHNGPLLCNKERVPLIHFNVHINSMRKSSGGLVHMTIN